MAVRKTPKRKLNLVLSDKQRQNNLGKLLFEDPSPIENKYVVIIVDQGISHVSYFSDATCQLDALYRASIDYFASHSQAGVSKILVAAFCENCDEEDSEKSRTTEVHFHTFPIPQ
jgi:hypothetical protein